MGQLLESVSFRGKYSQHECLNNQVTTEPDDMLHHDVVMRVSMSVRICESEHQRAK